MRVFRKNPVSSTSTHTGNSNHHLRLDNDLLTNRSHLSRPFLFVKTLLPASFRIALLLAAPLLHALEGNQIPDLASYRWPMQMQWENSDGASTRETYAGPFLEQRTLAEESYFALRPFGLETHSRVGGVDNDSLSILYPLFSYHNYDSHSQWSILSVIRWSEISTVHDPVAIETDLVTYYKKSFEVFPFYFNYNSWNPEYDYFAVFPFFGELKNRLFYDRISWVAFPFYSEWVDNDETTYAYFWPFVRYRTGPSSSGFSIWPLFGNFQREQDYHYRFALWPLLYYHQDKLYLETPETQIGILPLYARETRQSYQREDFLWPFFGYTLDDLNHYEEMRFLWPIFVQGRGNNRYLNQFAPLYSLSNRNGIESKWFLWPLFNSRSYELDGVNFNKFKFLYFIYQNTTQTIADQPDKILGTKRHFWPLFSYWKTAAGEKQFQMFSPLEPLFPNNSEIRRLYSPLFSIVRYQEVNPDHKDLEILFSLIHFQQRPEFERLELGPIFGYEYGDEKVRFDLLKGLLGYQRQNGRKILRLFWFSIDLGEAKAKGEQSDHE